MLNRPIRYGKEMCDSLDRTGYQYCVRIGCALTVVFFIFANAIVFFHMFEDRIASIKPAMVEFKVMTIDGKVIVHENFREKILEKMTITVDFAGRLGNAMFQFAFVYIQAKKHNLRIVLRPNPAIDLLQDAFEWDFKQYIVDWPEVVFKESNLFTTVVNKYDCAFDEEMIKRPMNNTRYIGFFQSWKYFKSYEKEIRTLFTLKPKLKEWAAITLRSTVQAKDDRDPAHVPLVAVHVRRGDILDLKELRDFGYQAATKEYFLKAMDYMRNIKELDRPLFIVGTNDVEWTKNVLSNYTDTVILKGNTATEDWMVLRGAHHVIMSVGSFGWWLCFLNDGNHIAYKNGFRPNSVYAGHHRDNPYEFYHQSWLTLE